jgi:hypothetical protein
MVKFATPLFRRFPNEAHFRVFDRFTNELNKAGAAVQAAIGPLSTELNIWFGEEKLNILWYRKSELTALIVAADRRLDNALVGMTAHVNAASYSANPLVAASGERLKIMLKSHSGLTKKPYLQQVGAVNAVLAHLKDDMATDAQAIGLVTWIAEIESALNEFVTLFEKREAQTLVKPSKTFVEVRHGIEDVWRKIAHLVNAGAALNMSPDFATLINVLNPEIEYLNNEFHRVKQSISTAHISTIDEQPYTGEPCTPVPEVLYETSKGATVKLVLGKDFNVSYKHNVNAGNAECIVRGKGAYKGSKTVSFTIAKA